MDLHQVKAQANEFHRDCSVDRLLGPVRQTFAFAFAQAILGHTEGTAGVAGLVLAAHTLRSLSSTLIPSLTQLNPFVLPALPGFGVARQHGPLVLCTSEQHAITSSFGMSGVNATALISGNDGLDLERPSPSVTSWEKSLLLPLPVPHPILVSWRRTGPSQTISWQVNLNSAAASALRDCYSVGEGHGKLPVGTMLELLGAAGQMLFGGASTVNLLQFTATSTPFTTAQSEELPLEVSLSLSNGLATCTNMTGQNVATSVFGSMPGALLTVAATGQHSQEPKTDAKVGWALVLDIRVTGGGAMPSIAEGTGAKGASRYQRSKS